MQNKKIDLQKVNKIYFIGIGGIGISAAARILKMQGKEVLGSDAVESEIIKQLKEEGIKVIISQKAENIADDIDLVIYTVAVPEDNPERQRSKELNIPEITYPQLLGELMKDKYSIGVSGTNGKTTTTAMLALIFMEAGLDPTVVLGSKVDFLGGNSHLSSSPLSKGGGQEGVSKKYFIFESDEYRRAFDNYNPKLTVVTYVSVDHLDFYKNLNDIKSAFSDYLKRVPDNGFIIINADDKNSLEIAKATKAKIVLFGIDNKADVQAKNIKLEAGHQSFDLYYQGRKLGEIILNLPAQYNVYNALAAISVALTEKVDFSVIKKALKKFQGAWRRFEKLGQVGKTVIMTDYAHTPDAVEQTITATKRFFPDKKILFVFQPHQYSRTKNFFDEFAKSFTGADEAMIMDVFYVKGREEPKDFDVDSKKLAQAAQKNGAEVEYITEDGLKEIVKHNEFDMIMMMGAGDIYEMAKKMISSVETRFVASKNDKVAEEIEKKYTRLDAQTQREMKGTGFSKQKAVVEQNRYYQGGKKPKINLVDKTRKK